MLEVMQLFDMKTLNRTWFSAGPFQNKTFDQMLLWTLKHQWIFSYATETSQDLQVYLYPPPHQAEDRKRFTHRICKKSVHKDFIERERESRVDYRPAEVQPNNQWVYSSHLHLDPKALVTSEWRTFIYSAVKKEELNMWFIFFFCSYRKSKCDWR